MQPITNLSEGTGYAGAYQHIYLILDGLNYKLLVSSRLFIQFSLDKTVEWLGNLCCVALQLDFTWPHLASCTSMNLNTYYQGTLIIFFGLQFITSNWVNGHTILVLSLQSLHKQRSIFPSRHKSMTSFKTWSLVSTLISGASLQKQKPAEFIEHHKKNHL